MVFTSSVELAFRMDAILKAQLSKAEYLLCLAWCLQADFEGSVEQSMVFIVFSQGKHDITNSVELAFRRDAILKAQSSKA